MYIFFVFRTQCSSSSHPTALSHCIAFSSTPVTLNENRLRGPGQCEPKYLYKALCVENGQGGLRIASVCKKKKKGVLGGAE